MDKGSDSDYATIEEILAAIDQYANAICYGMQEADIEDAKQEVALYFAKGRWHRRAFKRFVFTHLTDAVAKVKRINSRQKQDATLEPIAPSMDMAAELEQAAILATTAAADPVDAAIIRGLLRGDSKQQIAAAVGLSRSQVWRRVRAMQERITAVRQRLPD